MFRFGIRARFGTSVDWLTVGVPVEWVFKIYAERVDKKYSSIPNCVYCSQSDIVTLHGNWEKNTNLPCILKKLIWGCNS